MKATSQVNLDAFLAAYTGCQNGQQKQRALVCALAVLTGPSQASEPVLRLKALADHYGMHWTTAWRYAFPYRERFGHKVYLVSECDQYLVSEEFKARLAELRHQRQQGRGTQARRPGRKGRS